MASDFESDTDNSGDIDVKMIESILKEKLSSTMTSLSFYSKLD